MKNASKPRSKAFTLVELLVVIAIIAVLIAILLSVIMKARRKAIILASPIVFYTQKDNGYHLTDPTLSFDLQIFSERTSIPYRWPNRVHWSPSGQKMGFAISNWGANNSPQYMVIFNPLTGEMTKHAQMPANSSPRSQASLIKSASLPAFPNMQSKSSG